MQINKLILVAAFVLAGALATVAQAADISGAGATFPYPLYAKWADAYKKETGIGLNYQSIGSGGGIKQIQQKTVTFGASDMPLEPKELAKSGLVQFPTIIGGDVPVINLPGIKPGDLVLDGPTLANIFLGKITKWDDPAIQKLNPNLKLPSTAIVVVHRSDGSGTTFIFTNYLTKVSPDWADNVGAGATTPIAHEHSNPRQRGCRKQRNSDERRDRLRRIRLRQRKQYDVREDDQPRWQGRLAGRYRVPGRG